MARIGPGVAGGNNRQALTDADAEGRDLFKRWCVAAGLTVKTDKMGSMFARRDGTDLTCPRLWSAAISTIQPTGGKYDGPLGVLAALEIIRSLNDAGLDTSHPIEIVNWTNEEGCRFTADDGLCGVCRGANR